MPIKGSPSGLLDAGSGWSPLAFDLDNEKQTVLSLDDFVAWGDTQLEGFGLRVTTAPRAYQGRRINLDSQEERCSILISYFKIGDVSFLDILQKKHRGIHILMVIMLNSIFAISVGGVIIFSVEENELTNMVV